MLSIQVFGPGGTRSEYRSRIFWIDGRRTRAAAKAPQRKRPCRSRATARRSWSFRFASFRCDFMGRIDHMSECWRREASRVRHQRHQQGSFTQHGNDLGVRLNGFLSCPSSLSFGPSGTAHVTRSRTSASVEKRSASRHLLQHAAKKSIFVIAITSQTQTAALLNPRMFGGVSSEHFWIDGKRLRGHCEGATARKRPCSFPSAARRS